MILWYFRVENVSFQRRHTRKQGRLWLKLNDIWLSSRNGSWIEKRHWNYYLKRNVGVNDTSISLKWNKNICFMFSLRLRWQSVSQSVGQSALNAEYPICRFGSLRGKWLSKVIFRVIHMRCEWFFYIMKHSSAIKSN